MKIERPILRYHGGKFLRASWIASNFPSHRIYTECFGGAASVLMRKPRSYAEVYNDKWDTVVNVFRVMRDPAMAAELERVLRLTPYARREFELCGEDDIANEIDPVERARKTILRSFAGFGSAAVNGKYPTGFRANSNKSGTTPAHDWVNYPNHIKSFTERLKGVIIENRNYRDVVGQHDGPETLHFLDPPYVHATRNFDRGNAAYACEMSDQDHIDMASICSKLRGMVIICGYENVLYAELFRDWRLVKYTSIADGGRERTECLWSNRPATNLLF
jgi:DNA adenine methylase